MSSSKKIKEVKKHNISLVEFVNNYIGVYNSNINKKTTHEAIKILFPDIKRIGFNELEKNMEWFYNGNIIVVKDCKGECIPYLNPRIDYVHTIEETKEVIEEEFIFEGNLEDLKLYELLNLKKKCIFYKKRREYNKVVKEITTKVDYGAKNYKSRKEKVIRKEREEYYGKY